jgi:hypothetical protein
MKQTAQFYLQDVSYKMTVENYKTIDGVDCVSWTDGQGTHSMLKTAYDEMLAQAEQSTPNLAANAD